jgi:hypothetical protein
MKTKITLLIPLLMSFLGTAQTIEKFSVDSGGATATAGGLEIVYTIGEVNVQELNSGTIKVFEGFINADFKVKIDPKLFLQGPMINPAIAGLMNDNLRQGGFIPTTSPYADAATCNVDVFNVTGNNAIVDWVWVELRAANNSTQLINGKSALVQRDGDVVGLDGITNLSMYASPTNYFVVVKHRNHLDAITFGIAALKELVNSITILKKGKVIVEGHTDDVGNDATNNTLSLARAKSVSKALRQFIPSSNFKWVEKGYGESKPLVKNDSDKNRSKNRRVEILIVPN